MTILMCFHFSSCIWHSYWFVVVLLCFPDDLSRLFNYENCADNTKIKLLFWLQRWMRRLIWWILDKIWSFNWKNLDNGVSFSSVWNLKSNWSAKPQANEFCKNLYCFFKLVYSENLRNFSKLSKSKQLKTNLEISLLKSEVYELWSIKTFQITLFAKIASLKRYKFVTNFTNIIKTSKKSLDAQHHLPISVNWTKILPLSIQLSDECISLAITNHSIVFYFFLANANKGKRATIYQKTA